ncbi:ABC transporter substrate-binding protein [Planctomonas psychrotolerans]|uniref:ABC transporter substrate-binding protein n=1 Tax=Planctomonas psychrotolerans TaxID=2528712 RepID=UPI0012389E01|nr:extracellular solute-binding protein [Planctomonas psychrotolerans]
MNSSQSNPALSRRTFIGMASAAAMVPLLASCAPTTSGVASQESGEVTLNIWSNAPDFTKFFASRAEGLSESGPYDYTIEQLQSDAGDITTKALAAYAANGALPSLLGIEIAQFSRFMKNNIAGEALADLTDEMGAPRDAFYESRVQPYVSDGAIYAMESQFPLVTLYQRTDLYEQLQIPQADTWDDYIKIGGEIFAKHGTSLGVIANDDPTWFGMLLQQRGGHYFDEDGNLAIDSPEAVEVLQLLVDGANNGAFTVVSDFFGGPGTSLLKQNKVAAYFMPDWFNTFILQANAPEQSGLWKLAPLPLFAGGGHTTSVWGGTGFAVSKDIPERDAAIALLSDAYGTEDGQVDRFTQTGYLPTLKSAWDSPTVLEKTDPYLGGQRVMELYATLAPDAPTQYQSENWALLSTELGGAITAALTGRKTPAEAIKDAAASTESQSA